MANKFTERLIEGLRKLGWSPEEDTGYDEAARDFRMPVGSRQVGLDGKPLEEVASGEPTISFGYGGQQIPNLWRDKPDPTGGAVTFQTERSRKRWGN